MEEQLSSELFISSAVNDGLGLVVKWDNTTMKVYVRKSMLVADEIMMSRKPSACSFLVTFAGWAKIGQVVSFSLIYYSSFILYH